VTDGSSFLTVGGVPVVTAPTEIDVTTAGQMRAMLAEWAARGHITLVVDMTGTEFCDSAGLSVLVRAHKQALAERGELRVILPASGTVARLFSLTGLDRVIPHFASLEQALAQAGRAALTYGSDTAEAGAPHVPAQDGRSRRAHFRPGHA